jgi:hypothetical protein
MTFEEAKRLMMESPDSEVFCSPSIYLKVGNSDVVYEMEWAILDTHGHSDDPYVYGWIVNPHPREKVGYRWFYLRNATHFPEGGE